MNRRLIFRSTVIAVVVAAVAVFIAGRLNFVPQWLRLPVPVLKAPRASGELVILTLRGPTTTEDIPQAGKRRDETQTGFEHDLATLFATELGAQPKFIVMPSHQKLLGALEEGRGHLAAAGLLPNVELRARFAFGPTYKLVQHQLIYPTAEPKPRSLRDVATKRIAVIAETPAHDLLRELTGEFPAIAIDAIAHDSDPDMLLRRIETNASDFAVVDSSSFAVSKRLHPELGVAFKIGFEQKVAWAFSPIADDDLRQSAALFFDKIRNNGTLDRLLDRYYGHVNRIQAIDSEAILDKIQTLLPKLRPLFHEAQQLTGLDWRVIAAIGYQESHWDPLATSPTGVRGLMMLTEETADRMKVKNRLDARESIIGGAKYIVLLRDLVPSRIAEPDRTWLALAAYNQGYGHLEDARILAQRLKLNADSWLDVKKSYLKLKDPEHFEQLKHGFARGDEAVQFVENIRNYTDIITRLEKPLDMDIRYDLQLDDTTLSRNAPQKAQASSNVSTPR
jgi:membrane-bound lytic murein transglycosylase F